MAVITESGLKKLQDELEELKVVRRAENVEKIKEARAQGDLSENAEYDAARDEQRDIEARIAEIENIIKTSEVVSDEPSDKRKVNVGSKVTVQNIATGDNVDYTIVGASEVDVFANLISNESPLGSALIGHKKNDVVEFEAPAGKVSYKVIKISKAK